MPTVSCKSKPRIREPVNKKKSLLPTIKEDSPKKKLNKCSETPKNSPNKIKSSRKKLTPKMPLKVTSTP